MCTFEFQPAIAVLIIGVTKNGNFWEPTFSPQFMECPVEEKKAFKGEFLIPDSRTHLVNQPYWTSFLPLLPRIHTPQGI